MIGLFEATVYLESPFLSDPECSFLTPKSVVDVVGEFSPGEPWQVMVPCQYDDFLKCFKADIVIRRG